MSYMRGKHYLHTDHENIYIWAAHGYDHWDESIWADNVERHGEPGWRPSGVKIPFGILDMLVAMRMAELIEDGEMIAAIDRTLENCSGNWGAAALVKRAGELKEAVAALERPQQFNKGGADEKYPD